MSLKDDFGKIPLCNHRADRGLYIHGFCLPLCSRCTGILLGAAAGETVRFLLKKANGIKSPPAGVSPAAKLTAGILLAVPTGADGAAEYIGIRESSNRRRFITGFAAGFGCIIIEDGIVAGNHACVLRKIGRT